MSRRADYVEALIREIESSVDLGTGLSSAYASIALREVENLRLPPQLNLLLSEYRSDILRGRDAPPAFFDACDSWIASQADAWAASLGRAVRDLGYSVVDDSALPDSLETLVGDMCGPRDELSVECFRISCAQGEFRRDSPIGRHVRIQFGVPSSSRELQELKFMLNRILSYSLTANLLTFVLPASMCDFFACGTDDLAQQRFTYFGIGLRGWRFGDFRNESHENVSLGLIPIGNVLDISGLTKLCEYYSLTISEIRVVGYGMRIASAEEEFFQRSQGRFEP